MTKPEDIPQRVWDEAYAQAEELTFAQSFPEFLETVEIIARAILAAEKREREACAALAGEYVWDDHALAQATAIGLACHHQSLEIATAIRNRNGE